MTPEERDGTPAPDPPASMVGDTGGALPGDGGGAATGGRIDGRAARQVSRVIAADDRSSARTVGLRPLPPLAKRLNRNALTVAGAVAAMTVLTVVVVTRPSRTGGSDSQSSMPGEASAPTPARPLFLDQPPSPAPPRGASSGESGDSGTPSGARFGAAGDSRQASATDRATGLPVPPAIPDNEPAPADEGVREAGQGRLSRAQTYQAALTSGVLVASGSGGAAAARAAGGSAGRTTGGDARGGDVGADSTTRLPADATSGVSGAPGAPGAPGAHIEPAVSPFTLRAGTLIPAALITGVSSDLPGQVLAQTSRDVFDSRTQQLLLVPQGSRLVGSYDNRSVGTGRLIVVWTRLILPDGRGLTLARLAGTDESGQAGLHDQVDHHFGRVYGAALLTSAITAGVQLAQPQQSGLYAAPSSRQVAAAALGQTVGDVALESARRGLDVLPTVVIRPGHPFNVFVAGDLTFDGPYVPAPAWPSTPSDPSSSR